jgi:hypothetical protein
MPFFKNTRTEKFFSELSFNGDLSYNENMNDEMIHDLYSKFQRMRGIQRRAPAPVNPSPARTTADSLFEKLDRGALGSGPNTISRHLDQSFRSTHFDVGEGNVTVKPGTTEIVAQWFLPAAHSGVVKGFTQDFVLVPDQETVLWGLRINGDRVHGFTDFVGALSSPSFLRPIHYLLTGLDTLGTSSVSSGSAAPQQTPSVCLQATNTGAVDVTLRGRIVGFSFPVDEIVDNFRAF